MENNTITLPCVKYDETPVRIPMIAEMRTLLEKLLKDHKGDGPLIAIKSPKTALNTACKHLGMKRLTPHMFRHMFATRCLESGVDVRTCAAFLGHKDNGVTLMKRYSHIRDAHFQEMARKVQFCQPAIAPTPAVQP